MDILVAGTEGLAALAEHFFELSQNSFHSSTDNSNLPIANALVLAFAGITTSTGALLAPLSLSRQVLPTPPAPGAARPARAPPRERAAPPTVRANADAVHHGPPPPPPQCRPPAGAGTRGNPEPPGRETSRHGEGRPPPGRLVSTGS